MNIQWVRYKKGGCIGGKHRIDMDNIVRVWDVAGVTYKHNQYKCLDCGADIYLDSFHAAKQAKRSEQAR